MLVTDLLTYKMEANRIITKHGMSKELDIDRERIVRSSGRITPWSTCNRTK